MATYKVNALVIEPLKFVLFHGGKRYTEILYFMFTIFVESVSEVAKVTFESAKHILFIMYMPFFD